MTYHTYVLENLNSQVKLFSYTGDTALIITRTSWEIFVQNVESNMCKTNKWFLKYNLRSNFSKTKFIAFFQDIIRTVFKRTGITIDQHLK